MIKENISTVKGKIENACSKAARDINEIKLICVSKTKPVNMILEAYEAGERDFGENKALELASKYDELPKDIRWHQIGHLQTNKIKYIIDKAYLIHSVDSFHLAEEISKQAVKHNVTANILIEVNVAKEESKFGICPENAVEIIEEIAKLDNICIKGLMTVAPYVEDAEENRTIFAALKQLSVDITRKSIDNVSMEILSMGMSGDYEVAIEEGATYVRVGTAIFGQREYIKEGKG